MLKQDIMILEIGDMYINVMLGTSKKVSLFEKIKTPENAVINNDIKDIDSIINTIKKLKDEKDIKAKNLMFILKGQEVVIRHTEVPIMEEEKIEEAVRWEMSQYLPEEGEEHYIAFEIVDKISNKNAKVYKLIVAAVPREKLNKCFEIGKGLEMKLVAVDVAANCVSRAFKGLFEKDKLKKTVAIIDIGDTESSILILDNGKLFIQKELAIGINNIIKQLVSKYEISEDSALNYLIKVINLMKVNEKEDIQVDIKRALDNIFTSFERVIQFFNTGRTIKNLDKIYLVGNGRNIEGIVPYIHDFFNASVSKVDGVYDLGLPFKFSSSAQFEGQMKFLGALIRSKRNRELNLMPYEIKEENVKLIHKRKSISTALILIIIILFSIITPKAYLSQLQGEAKNIENKVSSHSQILIENKQLNKEKNYYKAYIDKVDEIKKNRVYILDWIQDIRQYIPSDTVLNSIVKVNDTITIEGKTKNTNSVPVFLVNLQRTGKYKSVNISSLNMEEDKNYKFTVIIKEEVK